MTSAVGQPHKRSLDPASLRGIALLGCLFLGLVACTKKESSQKDFWIYTSTYKEIISLYQPGLKKSFPELRFQWFQSGSENVAAKLRAELSAGQTPADLVMTSDLFSFEQWAREGHLASLEGTPGLDQIPPDHVRKESRFVITRFPVMVIAYNKKRIQAGDAPKSFADLLNPRFKGQITTPSPLESGTAMTSMLYLHEKLGLSFFEGLKKNRVLSAGGNGATLSRIQSGERPVGLVLLENILESRRRGVDWVEFVIPQEGALPIPSPLAVFKSTKDLETARRVAGWFLQAEAQNILVQGGVYSPMKGAPTPPGAPDWATLNKMAWSLDLFSQWTDQKESVKAAFNRIVLQ